MPFGPILMHDTISGEEPLPPSRLDSPILRRFGLKVVAHSVKSCYETWPFLEEYGERGRQHVIQDSLWHLEHLDSAVSTGEPQIFADYADWLSDLLEARGIDREQVAGAFGFLADSIDGLKCTPSQEAHRRELVSILRANQLRLLR